MLNKRERIILYLTVGLIILGLGFNLVLKPALAKNRVLNKEINNTRAKLKKYLQLLAQKEEIESKFNKFSASQNNPDFEGNAAIGALSEIENLAKKANIRIIDLRPQSLETGDLYKEALIELKTEGTMDNYLKFIYTIESSLSLLKIKRFELNVQPNSGLLEANISLSQISPE